MRGVLTVQKLSQEMEDPKGRGKAWKAIDMLMRGTEGSSANEEARSAEVGFLERIALWFPSSGRLQWWKFKESKSSGTQRLGLPELPSAHSSKAIRKGKNKWVFVSLSVELGNLSWR